jgi:hypothetical protein
MQTYVKKKLPLLWTWRLYLANSWKPMLSCTRSVLEYFADAEITKNNNITYWAYGKP